MRRREFIAGVATVAWPIAARAQQPVRMRRIGVLMDRDENDPAEKANLSGFAQALGELGWTDGRNLRTDVRWAGSNIELTRTFAKELVGLQPDAILANTTPATAALQRETRTIPIVFVSVSTAARDLLVRSPDVHDGGDRLGMVHEARGDSRQAADCYRKVIDFIRQHSDDYDP